jgi:signal transduction histidine kinase
MPGGASDFNFEERLRYRRAMEDRLLSILRRFVAAGDDTEAAIAEALEECARFSGAEGGQIIRVSDDGRTFSITNMWWSEPVPTDATPVRDVPFDHLPAETRAGRVLRIPDVSALPEGLPYKDSLREYGVRALLNVPVQTGDTIVGAIGLSFSNGVHEWTEEEELLVHFFAGALGHALLRIRAAKQRAELEARLARAQRMEVAARTASGIAHDFRNMLTVVSTCAEIASRPTVREPERQELLAEIAMATQRATELASRLMRLGQAEPEEMRSVDLGALVRGLAATLRRLLSDFVQLEVVVSSDVPLLVRADRTELEQAISNLCINARDASRVGDRVVLSVARTVVRAQGSVRGAAVRDGDHVVLAVRDHGTGIAPEHVPRLFEPYFTTKAPGQGTGLGLATVYAMCRRCGGWADVETALGCGSEFRLYFPAVPSSLLPAQS